MVIAPEHPAVERLTTQEQKSGVEEYCRQASFKSDLDRTDLAKEKTGVFSGSYALNPVDGRQIPIWIADYVLASYGTGAIMAVPAHDARDFEFAKQFALPIRQVVAPAPDSTISQGEAAELEDAFTEPGVAINSGEYDGLPTAEFKSLIRRFGKKRVLDVKQSITNCETGSLVVSISGASLFLCCVNSTIMEPQQAS